jgi:hypothetical protein
VGVTEQPVMPVVVVVTLAVIAFCAPMLVVVLSRGSLRSVPRRARSARRTSPTVVRVERPRAARPPLPRREPRTDRLDDAATGGWRQELPGTVLHAVPPGSDPAPVVAELARAGFATVVDPLDDQLILVEAPRDAERHELVRRILTRRVG